MKPNLYLFVLLFTGIIFTSCKKSNISHETSFEKSYKEWLSFKETSGNSYRYMVGGGSWTGLGWQTLITVNNGKIIKREFKYNLPVGWQGNIPSDEMEWVENENEINSHTSAAGAITLDEIYEKARNNWLKKRGNAKTYFEAKNHGLISSCGYIEDGCQDDCFVGITINYIELL